MTQTHKKSTPPDTSLEKKATVSEPHYVCTGGCNFVSNNPGKCKSVGCVRARNPLTACLCSDQKHGNLLTLNATKVAR